MLSDDEVKKQVERELEWVTNVAASDIGVSVKNSVVTLSGFTHSFGDKVQAERCAKGVAGVAGVANDIEVRLAGEARPDPEIARDAVAVLKAQLPGSSDMIKVVVQDGVLRLEGRVAWNYQRQRAEEAVHHLRGVRSVLNQLALKPTASAGEVRQKILSAFQRSAALDAARLVVEASGARVVLSGSVRSFMEREDAEKAAWHAPGVTEVENHIKIDPTLAC
ncbi:BON domain-containing protein [Janthinobacterium sp. J1-1]|uniref:BON domain-containing protein n=1 Tax=Janthinobacterium sp. J1-1 TaxID=3065910 RepID=UPI0028123F50|nr:BON domain-containing protein [Janthinobacterium sp. J1-1]